jgi:SAM-dependent methyltransferase
MSEPEAEQARRIITEARGEGDPTGWFDRLYFEAARSGVTVPWDRGVPQPLLVEWARDRSFAGGRALVVGAGLGADAEFVAGLGFDTVAFDISPTAVEAARARHPGSPVEYRVADVLEPPADWRHAFDLVFESFTAQALPEPYRGRVIREVPSLVAPGGTLLVVAAAREDGEAADGPPWPLFRAEVEAFATEGLEPVRIERLDGRWRAEFRRSGRTG